MPIPATLIRSPASQTLSLFISGQGLTLVIAGLPELFLMPHTRGGASDWSDSIILASDWSVTGTHSGCCWSACTGPGATY